MTWLAGQVETKRFNDLYSVRSPDISEADFLAVVVERAKAIYEHAFHELTRQVPFTPFRASLNQVQSLKAPSVHSCPVYRAAPGRKPSRDAGSHGMSHIKAGRGAARAPAKSQASESGALGIGLSLSFFSPLFPEKGSRGSRTS